MAEKSIIISAEEEAILLKPIDEYVGKIQEQIDALRVEGSDKVNYNSRQNATTATYRSSSQTSYKFLTRYYQLYSKRKRKDS